MITGQRAGRPRASSRETLAEAASELFLEKGYEATSVADITQRAGVSRSSFFNYFASKSDVVWLGLDERIADFEQAVASGADAASALARIADGFGPDPLALAMMNAGAMHLEGELDREAGVRQMRIARAVAQRLVTDGVDPLTAEVRAAAAGGAVLAAIRAWAAQGPGSSSLTEMLQRALAVALD